MSNFSIAMLIPISLFVAIFLYGIYVLCRCKRYEEMKKRCTKNIEASVTSCDKIDLGKIYREDGVTNAYICVFKSQDNKEYTDHQRYCSKKYDYGQQIILHINPDDNREFFTDEEKYIYLRSTAIICIIGGALGLLFAIYMAIA